MPLRSIISLNFGSNQTISKDQSFLCTFTRKGGLIINNLFDGGFYQKFPLSINHKNIDNIVQGCRNCSILPSRMGEHGVSLENMGNMENMEKMENINQMTQKSPEDF